MEMRTWGRRRGWGWNCECPEPGLMHRAPALPPGEGAECAETGKDEPGRSRGSSRKGCCGDHTGSCQCPWGDFLCTPAGHGGHRVPGGAILGARRGQRPDTRAEDGRGGNPSETTGSVGRRGSAWSGVAPRLGETPGWRPGEHGVPAGVGTWLQKPRAALGMAGDFTSDARRAPSWGGGRGAERLGASMREPPPTEPGLAANACLAQLRVGERLVSGFSWGVRYRVGLGYQG